MKWAGFFVWMSIIIVRLAVELIHVSMTIKRCFHCTDWTVIYCCTCSFDTSQALRNQNSHPSTAMEGTSNNRTHWASTLSHLIPAGQFSLQAGILPLEGYLNDHSSISRELPRSDEIKRGFKLFNLWQTLIPSTTIATISCIKTRFNRDLSQAYMYRETAKALPIRKPLWLLLWWSNSSTQLTGGWYTVQPWSIEPLEGFQNQKRPWPP